MKPSCQHCNLSQFLISISLISTSQVIIHTLPSISLGIFIGGEKAKWSLLFLCSTFPIWLLPSPVYWKFSWHGPLVTKLKVSFSPLLKGPLSKCETTLTNLSFQYTVPCFWVILWLPSYFSWFTLLAPHLLPIHSILYMVLGTRSFSSPSDLICYYELNYYPWPGDSQVYIYFLLLTPEFQMSLFLSPIIPALIWPHTMMVMKEDSQHGVEQRVDIDSEAKDPPW